MQFLKLISQLEKLFFKKNVGIISIVSITCATLWYLLKKTSHPSQSKDRKRTLTQKSKVSARRENEIAGLQNATGTLCYTNGVVQALASCPSFYTWIQQLLEVTRDLEHQPLNSSSPCTNAAARALLKITQNQHHKRWKIYGNHQDDMPLLFQLYKVICDVNGGCGSPSSVEGVFLALCDHRWQIGVGEHDCHEMLSALFTTICIELEAVERIMGYSVSAPDEQTPSPGCHLTYRQSYGSMASSLLDVAWVTPSELEEAGTASIDGRNTLLSNAACAALLRSTRSDLKLQSNHTPFGGFYASQLQCLWCLKKSTAQWASFDTVSLVLPTRLSLLPISLEELLSNFTDPELVEGVNCAHCSHVHGRPVKRTFNKRQTIGKLPELLSLHVCRSVWWPGQHCPSKRDDRVTFPLLLDMTPYTFTYALNNAAAAAASAHSTARGVVGLSRLLAKTFNATSSDAVATKPPPPTDAASATFNPPVSISSAAVPVSWSTVALSRASTSLSAAGSVVSFSDSGSIASASGSISSASIIDSAATISSQVTIAAPCAGSAGFHDPESTGVPGSAGVLGVSYEVFSQVYSGIALSSATTFAGDVPSNNGLLSATSKSTAVEPTEPSGNALAFRTFDDTQEPNTCGKEKPNCDSVTSVNQMNDVDCPPLSRAVSPASGDSASYLSPRNCCNEPTDDKNSQVSSAATIQISDMPRSRRGTGSISQAESCDNSNTNVNILNKLTLIEANVTSSGDYTSSAVVSDHLPSLLNKSDSLNQTRSSAPLNPNELLQRNAAAGSSDGLASSDQVPPQQETQNVCTLSASVSNLKDSSQSVNRSSSVVSSELPGVASVPDKSLPVEDQRTSPASVVSLLTTEDCRPLVNGAVASRSTAAEARGQRRPSGKRRVNNTRPSTGRGGGCLYSLQAVVVHSGSASSGHFVTYRRGPDNSLNWYYTSDTVVRPVSCSDVLKAVPYVLLYQRYSTA